LETSIKTVKLPLVKPNRETERELLRLFRDFRWVYDQTARRLPSIPRKRIGQSKHPMYYHWVKEYRSHVDLFAQVAQEAVQKARESYASMLGNKVYDGIPRSGRNVARFHNQCFHINRFGNIYILDIPVRGGRRNNRVLLAFKPNDYSEQYLRPVVQSKLKYGASELKQYGGEWWFNLTIKEPVEVHEGGTPVGVDFGLRNIAVACAYSEGGPHVKLWSGKKAQHKRRLYLEKIADLERKGLLRKVKSLKSRYRDYMYTENHRISREIIEYAKTHPEPIIILEDLHKFRKENDWTFAELRTFIEYKALDAGIPVMAVNPKNTSNTCNKCGYTDSMNRNGIIFKCLGCGYEVNADVNAAINLSSYMRR